MRLDDALSQIADIREHLSRAAVFRGYRASTCVLTAGIAVAAALVQQAVVGDVRREFDTYLLVWCAAAVELCWQNRNRFISESERPTAEEAYQRAVARYLEIADEAK